MVRSTPFQKTAQRKGLSRAFKAASTPSPLPPVPEEGDVPGTTLLLRHRLGSSPTYTPWVLPQPPETACRWMALGTWPPVSPFHTDRHYGQGTTGPTGCPGPVPTSWALMMRCNICLTADLTEPSDLYYREVPSERLKVFINMVTDILYTYI